MGWILSAQVVLHHPFMLHTSSPNPSGVPRFITNPVSVLKEPMQFNRPDGAGTCSNACKRDAAFRTRCRAMHMCNPVLVYPRIINILEGSST